MSERPFMQLYVSDYLGDTRHLSCEQHGAYMLLLMTMWNAGGELPDDDVKLARIVCLSLKKWRATRDDILTFFEVDAGVIRHNRMTKELQKSERKSQSRASAGAKGYAAKALKNNKPTQAIASGLPKHSPDTRDHIAASQQRARIDYDGVMDKLLTAAGLSGFREERSPSLMNLAPILGLLDAGFDLEREILPAIQTKAATGFVLRSWKLVPDIVREFAEKRRGAAATPRAAPKPIDWPARMEAFEQGIWPHAWGPKPGEPGCGAPAELLEATRAAA